MSEDFENLINAPISTSYFSFKSEKNWTQHGTFEYNELFSVDMNNLCMIYNCIPLNQYLEVEDNYFTKDQLTYLTSAAEHAKKVYEMKLLQRKNSVASKHIRQSTCEDATEEDLDFLLSLKEPDNISIATVKFQTNESKVKGPSKKLESIDLETWLDSVLDE